MAAWEKIANLRGSSNTTVIATNAIPLESPNGSRMQFTVPSAYLSGTLMVYLNGLREYHITEDSSTTFSFTTAPWTGDTIRLDYVEI